MSDYDGKIASGSDALVQYLDDLLFDESTPVTELKVAEPSAVVTHEVLVPDVAEEQSVAPVTDVEIAQTFEQPVSETAPVVLESEPQETLEKAKASGVPQWAKHDFKVLLFKVSGVQMAVPLSRLSGMIKKPGEIHEVALTPAWYTGIMEYRGETVQVVDTHVLIMPERQKQTSATEVQEHLMLICDGRWGLSVDELEEVVTLNADKVHWRGAKGKRPWLAGTVMEKLSAILDVDALEPMLDGAGTNPNE